LRELLLLLLLLLLYGLERLSSVVSRGLSSL
jgi:hypothetical protein